MILLLYIMKIKIFLGDWDNNRIFGYISSFCFPLHNDSFNKKNNSCYPMVVHIFILYYVGFACKLYWIRKKCSYH